MLRFGEGGLLGAFQRVKERKAAQVEAERAAAHQPPRRRPGQNRQGGSDGTLGISDIAVTLAALNNGTTTSHQISFLALMRKAGTGLRK